MEERSSRRAKWTLDKLGVNRRTFYRWYDRYLHYGEGGLVDRTPHTCRVWNKIPDKARFIEVYKKRISIFCPVLFLCCIQQLMRLRHIEIFHAVYMTGSVSGAAKSLNVSQPTVSKILRHAEDQLGFELFYREKGRIFPTEKANLLFTQIIPVYEQLNELKKYTVMLKSTNVGRLRIAMTPAFSLQAVPRALAAFNKKHPDIPIEIETQHASEISRLIQNSTIDLGIVFEAVSQPGLEIQHLGQTEFVCVTPKSHKNFNRKISLEDLATLPLIRLNAKSPLGHMLNKKLEGLGLYPDGSNIVAETYHLAKRLVEQGTGVAVIDKITAYSGTKTQLRFHELPDLEPIKIDVISRSNDPIISFKQDFLAILKAELITYAG